MALFLQKDFMKMEETKFLETMVHYGTPQCTNRTFRDIMGRDNRTACELRFLQEIIDELDHGENNFDFPFASLLRVEYGEDICPVKELPELVLDYLSNTPHTMVWLDYQQAIRIIRERFKLIECERCDGFPASGCKINGPQQYARAGI